MKRSFPLIFLLFIYFTFLGGSLYTFTSFPLKVFNHILVTLILGIWLVGKLRRKSPLPQTPLDWAIAFWLGVQLISAGFSIYPRFSFESLWQPITHALAFYLLLDLLPRHKGHLVKALYLSATVVCLIGLIEFASWYFGLPLLSQFGQSWPEISGWADPLPPYLYRLNFTLNGATSLSAYLAMLIPPALALRMTLRKKDDRQALTIWLVLAVVVEILAFSRGGILALVTSLPIFFALWFFLKSPDTGLVPRLKRLPKTAIMAVIGLVLVVGLLGLLVFRQRTTALLTGDQVRLDLWQSALSMAADYPALGVGPKLYGLAVRDYRNPQHARDQITTAHNLYLNTAAETGLLGLLAGAWLIAATARAAWRNWQAAASFSRRAGFNRRLRLAGVIAALVGFGVQSLVDTFNATQIILPLMLGVAYLISPGEGFRQVLSPLHLTWRPLAMLAILGLYVILLARWDVAQWHFQRASGLAQTGEFEAALAAIDQAAALDPQLTLYRFEQAYYQSRLAETEPAYLDQAIATYQAALQTENSNPTYHANLAALLQQGGDLSGAVTSLEAALTLVPGEPTLLLNLGYLYESQGDEDQAMTHYAAAITALPDLLDSGFWGSARQNQLMEVIQQQTRDHLLLSRLAQMKPDPAQAEVWARQAIREAPAQPDGYLALAEALLAQNRPAEALEILNEKALPLANEPQQGTVYRLRGLANYLLGNEMAAVQDLKTALFFSPFSQAQAYVTLGQIFEAQGRLEAARQAYGRAIPPNIISQNYDVVVYGRGARHPTLVPQLLDIGYGERHAETWLALSRLYETTGDVEKAQQVLDQFQLRYPYLSEPRATP